MQQQKPQVIKATSHLPDPKLLTRAWATDSLKKMEQEELAGWYDNMREGLNLDGNNLILQYLGKKSTTTFTIEPKKIILPDGTVKILDSPKEHDGDVGLHKTPQQLITNVILGNQTVDNPDTPNVALRMTPRKFIEELVAEQFRVLEEHGVERGGVIEESLGKPRHQDSGYYNLVTTPLDRYQLRDDGSIAPLMNMRISTRISPKTKRICRYHTHPGAKDLYPSRVDIATMHSEGETSEVIASKQEDDSFRVVEWKLKPGATLPDTQEEQGNQRYIRPSNWPRGKEWDAFIDQRFDRRQFILKKEPDRTVSFKEAPPQK